MKEEQCDDTRVCYLHFILTAIYISGVYSPSGVKVRFEGHCPDLVGVQTKLKNLQLAHGETNGTGFPSIRILHVGCPVQTKTGTTG